MGYNNCSVEELNIKIGEENKELKYLHAYRTIINSGIKCDYTKLKEKISMDELSELLKIFSSDNMGIYTEYNDRRKKKNNPFFEVIIDKTDEKRWDILTIKDRVASIEKQIYQQEEKIEMIRQICSRKEGTEKAEDTPVESDKNEQENTTQEVSDARKMKIAKLKELIAMKDQLEVEIQRMTDEIRKEFNR